MKIRSGFVSNSSSSSFIILVKNGKELTKDLLMKGISKDTVFYSLADAIAETLVNISELQEKGEFINDDYVLPENDDLFKLLLNCSNTKLYSGSCSSEGDTAIEQALCQIDINYEDEDILIIKEGNY